MGDQCIAMVGELNEVSETSCVSNTELLVRKGSDMFTTTKENRVLFELHVSSESIVM